MPDEPIYPGAPTSIAAFLGRTRRGPVNRPVPVSSFADFERRFGGLWPQSTVSFAVRDFFSNGGTQALVVRVSRSAVETSDYLGGETGRTGIFALEKADLFNLLCIPPYAPGRDVESDLWGVAAAYCVRRRAILLVDPPMGWTTMEAVRGDGTSTGVAELARSIGSENLKNAAVYFPRVVQPNPLNAGAPEPFVPCGAIAGVMARTDAQGGVWKAPAGRAASLTGVLRPAVPLSDLDNGELNPRAINCIRAMPSGECVAWGARTLAGDDRLGSDWKYIPVRRMALYIEESLRRGTEWVTAEPNAEPLWARIRLAVDAFLHTLFRQGAFAGATPPQAYFVKCDSTTTTDADVDSAIVRFLVGFAPVKPAEYLVLRIERPTRPVEA